MLDELEQEFLQNVKALKEQYDFIVVHGAGRIFHRNCKR